MANNLDLREPEVLDIPKGYRAYKIKGVDHTIIARKGGPTADQIKNQDSYLELRNNQKEFGVASILAKSLRDSIPSELYKISEKYVSGKLTAQFRNLAKLEKGTTGTRSFILSDHAGELQGFDFNPDSPFPEAFSDRFFIREGSHRGHAILHFPEFIPSQMFNAPEGTTNFKISAHIVSLSDFYFDEEVGAYYPANPEFQGKFGSFETQMLPLLNFPVQPMTGQLSVNQGRSVPMKTGIFLIMAIRFFKYADSKFEHLNHGSSMRILRTF